jgi:hypothetical protein
VLVGKTCPSATLSTTNPTRTDPGSKPGLRGERPVANRLSHGTEQLVFLRPKPHMRYFLVDGASFVGVRFGVPMYINISGAVCCDTGSASRCGALVRFVKLF